MWVGGGGGSSGWKREGHGVEAAEVVNTTHTHTRKGVLNKTGVETKDE